MTSEDCLSLNVWSPRGAAGLPVVVWLHGGAFRTGATRMPLMNGASFAQKGVVVVTVNHRLGALGLLVHPDFQDSQNGSSANWQLQDMGAALRWVHDNIAAFGGDPNRICVMGQSGGAMSAALLAQNPVYRGYIQKAVLLSPPSVVAPMSMSHDDSIAYTELLAKRLATTPRGLRDIPAQTLHNTELALNAEPLPSSFTTGTVIKLAPLVDGITCLGDWARLPWPSDLPVFINYTLDEGAFWFNLIDPVGPRVLTPAAPPTAAALVRAVTGLVGGSATTAAAVIDTYGRAATRDGRSTAPADLWVDHAGHGLLQGQGGRGASGVAVIRSNDGRTRLVRARQRADRPWPLYRPGVNSAVRWGEGMDATEDRKRARPDFGRKPAYGRSRPAPPLHVVRNILGHGSIKSTE